MGLLTDAARMNALIAVGGEAVTVDGATVTAVVRQQYVETNGIEGQRTTALCRTSDVSGADHGDAVAVGSTSYTIQAIEPRDDGLTLLVLEES